jgi:hypothetical protein
MASFLGIDLSKETFHAFLLSDRADAKKVFPNTPKGFEQLTTWLKNRHPDEVRFCMEATGSYWEALAFWWRPQAYGTSWKHGTWPDCSSRVGRSLRQCLGLPSEPGRDEVN